MKKKLACFLVVVMTLSLTACGTNASTSTTANGVAASNDTATVTEAPADVPAVDEARSSTANTDEKADKVVIGINADPQDLLPINPNAPGKNVIWHEIYECLCDMKDGDYAPVLMKDYTVVDDLHYDVTINDNIYDADGNHITADDVVFSYNYLVDSGYAIKYDQFQSISKVDDYTVEFTWTSPIESLGALEFIWCGTAIFSEKAFNDHNFATEPVATGPYVVSEFTSGSKVVLVANTKYWQTDAANLLPNHAQNVNTIEYNIITEAAQQTIALETGTIDYSISADENSMAEFMDGGQYADLYNTVATVGNTSYVLMPNCSTDNLLSDVNLRQAIFYGISNSACAEAVVNAEPAVTCGTSVFSDYLASWETDKNYMTGYDATLAAEYLAKTSYKNESLKLITLNTETASNTAQIIQSFLLNLGITVDIETYDSTTLQTKIAEPDSWDLCLLTIAAGGFQINAMQCIMDNTLYTSGLSYNFIKDDVLQQKFETCNTITGHTAENMDDLQQYWITNAYYDGILNPTNVAVASSDIADICYDANKNMVPGGCTYYLDK